MDASAIPLVAGGVVAAGMVGVGIPVPTSLGVAGATVAVLMGVKSMMATPVPVAEAEEPKKKKTKKTIIKKDREPSEDEEEEEEEKLSKNQIRRLLAKKKQEAAAAKAAQAAAQAKKAAAAEKKKGKKKGKAKEPEKKAEPEPEPEPVAPTKKKKKKGKKKEEPAPKPVSSSDDDDEPADTDVWEQQKGQVKSAARQAKAAGKKAASQAEKSALLNKPKEVVVECASKHHGLIIGEKGSMLKALSEGTGCTITMPKKDSGTQFITVAGDARGVALVKKSIKQLIATGISDVTHPDTVSNEIDVASKFHGLLIGPGGSNIRSIQTKLGCKVNMPEKGTDSTIVKLVGSDSAVAQAKEVIRALIEDGYSDITHEGYLKVQVVFPQSHLKHLIGPKGETVKRLQAETKARINIPGRDERGAGGGTVLITVVGPHQGVQAAQMEMQKIASIIEEDMTPVLLAPEAAWGGGNAELSAQNEW